MVVRSAKARRLCLLEFVSVYSRYQSQLNKVEKRLQFEVASVQQDIHSAASTLLTAGGKRIRPLFTLICSQLGKPHQYWDEIERVACALELIHMATLVHDDVIDHADLRRGSPTVRSRYGNLAAMYVGDYLFAKAISLLSGIQNARVHFELSNAIVKLCKGEIEQIRDLFNWDQTLHNYLRRIERKTALLISVSCSLGAIVSDAPERDIYLLRKFGYWTGMAFQVIDDVLDFSGEQSTVGKPVAGDLRQGNLTLPTLLARRKSDGKRLMKLVRPEMTATDADEAIDIVRQSGCIEEARNFAKLCMEKAIVYLDQITDLDSRNELQIVAQFVNERLF